MSWLSSFVKNIANPDSNPNPETTKMSTTFDKAFENTIGIEGGYTNDPTDAGGETNFGITISTARIYGYTGDMKDLPLDTAKAIYKQNYWDINRLDEIVNLSPSLAIELFDSGVNVGVKTPIKWLQQGLNVLSRNNTLFHHIDTDGLIGQGTISTLALLNPTDLDILFKIVNIYQGYYYLSICTTNSSQEKFIRGWLKRVSFDEIA